MKDHLNQNKHFLYSIFEPKAMIFGLAMFHFLSMAVYVGRALQTKSGRDADVYLYMFEPLSLLIAAFGLWRSRLLGYLVSLLISGLMVYQMGFLAYLRIAEWAGVSAFNPRALSCFYWMMFGSGEVFTDGPRYAFQLALACVIASYSTALLSLMIFRRWRGAG